MTLPTNTTSPPRFALRSTLIVVTGMVIILGITAPWIRTWVFPQWIVAGGMAFGMFFVGGMWLSSYLSESATAKRRGGPYHASLRNRLHSVVIIKTFSGFNVVMGLCFFYLASSSIRDATDVTAPTAAIAGFITGCMTGGGVIGLFTLGRPIEVREFGLVMYDSLRPWNRVIAYRWRDATTVVLTVQFSKRMREETYVVTNEHRAGVDAILADKVRASR